MAKFLVVIVLSTLLLICQNALGSPVDSWIDEEPVGHHSPRKRAATSHKDRLWPQGIVPFSIDANFTAENRELIIDGMRKWEDKTCIRFYPLSTYNSTFGVNFHNPNRPRCSSFVGRMGDNIQQVYLSPLCITVTVVLHEMGHTVGFWHEHSRPDRDQYVTVHFENIRPDRRNLFGIEPDIDSLGQTYDYNSVMHYTDSLFSIDGSSVTISANEKGIPVGGGADLSPLDIRQINLLYKDQCSLRSSSESRLPPKVPLPSPVNLSSWSCSEHLIGASGQFSPPDDPYMSNTDCVWAIEVPTGHGVQLQIDGIDIECDNGEISVYSDHDIEEIENADVTLCNQTTYTYNTSQQYVYVRLHTNDELNANNMSGFSKAEFTAYDINECEMYTFCDQGCVNLNGSYECTCKDGYYWSGGFGYGCFDVNECGYDNGNCSHTCVNMGGTYRCECPAGYILHSNKLDCVDVNECLSDNGGCNHVCVNIDGSFECSCNTSYILAADNKTCVTPDYCDSYTVLRKSSGRISISQYAPNSNCTWIIALPRQYNSIKLRFGRMSIEKSNDCVKDRLTILNGRYAPLMIGSYCGHQSPANIQTSTRTVTINFISDDAVTDEGFMIKYQGLERRVRGIHRCDIVLNRNITFTLPAFPLKYRAPVNCTYSLVGPGNRGQRIKITFLYLDILNADCSMDRIEVYDGMDLIANICSGIHTTEYISQQQDMTLRYIGNTQRTYRGFHASVSFF